MLTENTELEKLPSTRLKTLPVLSAFRCGVLSVSKYVLIFDEGFTITKIFASYVISSISFSCVLYPHNCFFFIPCLSYLEIPSLLRPLLCFQAFPRVVISFHRFVLNFTSVSGSGLGYIDVRVRETESVVLLAYY